MKKGVDYTGVTVVFFCHDGNGRYVLGKRSKNTRDEQGKWDTGGGGVEFGERVEEALRKEIKEEYCTDVVEFEFLGYRDVHRENDKERTHWIALDYKVLVAPEKVRNGEPHKIDEIGWYRLDSLPKGLHSQLSRTIEKYKDRF